MFFAIILLVLQGQDANLLSIGAVDFGIIVDSAVILVENIFRNFQSMPNCRQQMVEELRQGTYGHDPTTVGRRPGPGPPAAADLLISALQVDKAMLFSTPITVAAFVPLFTMQGVEGQIFGPMARTYGYALAGALSPPSP